MVRREHRKTMSNRLDRGQAEKGLVGCGEECVLACFRLLSLSFFNSSVAYSVTLVSGVQHSDLTVPYITQCPSRECVLSCKSKRSP